LDIGYRAIPNLIFGDLYGHFSAINWSFMFLSPEASIALLKPVIYRIKDFTVKNNLVFI